MPITAITIENFKGIRDTVRVELKPVTLLFGPNSAGKSTIIQALHYAREIFERQNLNPDKALLGGDSIDLGGFESLVYQHDLKLPIKLGFELDLSNEDLPRYTSGLSEIEYYGTDMLELSGGGNLLDVLQRVMHAKVEVTIRWSEQFLRPYLAAYTVHTNGEVLVSIESSPDGKQVYIDNLNAFNPVFFKDVNPDAVIKQLIAYLQTNKAQEPPPENSEVKQAIETLGDMFGSILDYMNVEVGIPGLSVALNLWGQKSSLPNWGGNLSIDASVWKDDLEMGSIPNFVRMLSSLTVGPGELVRDNLLKLCYIGPLRKVPSRNHKPATSPDESRWANGLAAYDTLFFSDNGFIDKVNEWLTQEKKLNSGYNVEIKKYREVETDNPLMLALLQGRILDEDVNLSERLLNLPVKRRLLIRDEARNIELDPQDIGVGISQVLPVIVAALHRKTGFVVIEQPELHIHPAFQVSLGDLFIEQVRQYPDLNFILETHSEHLLLRFLRRIRETGENEAPKNLTLSPSELSIYFIEQGDTGITCTPIRVDKDGDFIDRWPKGFFNERVKELY